MVSRTRRGQGNAKRGTLKQCGEYQRRKKLYKCILQMGHYWPTMNRDAAEFVKKCHGCQVQANLIHTHPQNLQTMVTSWPFHI